MLEQFERAPYNYLIKKKNICTIPLTERHFINSSAVFEFNIYVHMDILIIFNQYLTGNIM